MVRFVWSDGTVERELAVDAADETPLAEVLSAAGIDDPGALTVDGRGVPTDHSVVESGLLDGVVVAPGRPPATAGDDGRRCPVGAGPRVAVVAGVRSGAAVPVSRPVVVGRDPGTDLRVASTTVSGRHCRIAPDGAGGVVVEDLGSTNGTWVDGVSVSGTATAPIGALVRIGAVLLRILGPEPDDRPSRLRTIAAPGASTVPLDRPPRPALPTAAGDLEVPPPAPVPAPPPAFGIVAVLAPLAVGGVMVAVTGSLLYAVVLLLSPVLAIANAVTRRRRHGRDQRRAIVEHASAVVAFTTRLAELAEHESRRRWSVLTSLPEVLRRAHQPSTRLWERRPGRHDDALVLTLGVGAGAWRPPLRSTPPSQVLDADVRDALDRHRHLQRTPVAVDLTAGVVGVVGDPAAARALVRSLVLQAAVLHGPADLGLAVVADTDRIGEWHWSTWLPHVTDPSAGGDRRLAAGDPASHELLARLLADRAAADAAGDRGSGTAGSSRGTPPLMVVVDHAEALHGHGSPGRALLRRDDVVGVVVAATEDALPAVCTVVVSVLDGDGSATVTDHLRREGPAAGSFIVAGIDVGAARAAARRLARFHDPEAGGPDDALPVHVDLVDLLGTDVSDPAVLTRLWASTRDADDLATPIGVGADGPMVLDLATDGPHALVAGTTGAGKSELLRSLVAGLAVRHGPDDVTFVLVDYKGGAAFDACAGLPHVVGVVTDLDEHLAERALTSLDAELRHRERRLRDAGVGDLDAWRRLSPDRRGPALPRLVVAVDEFATLRAELPDFVAALVAVAQRGRSLGVHLVLGTQRPSGAVDEDVRANTNLRIALRVTDRGDSMDVVGVSAAADIPPGRPGRGVVRVGPQAVRSVQAALVTGRSGAVDRRVTVRVPTFGPRDRPAVRDLAGATAGAGRAMPSAPSAPSTPSGRDALEDPSDLERLVGTARVAAARLGVAAPRRPWLPPLPERIAPDELPDATTSTSGRELPMVLLDLPDQQQQVATGWDPTAGPLLLHGAVGSGTTTAAAAAVLAAAAVRSPDELHVHAIDLGRGGLSPLERLPHVGDVVPARDRERRLRLLRWLESEADRRRACSAAELAARPLLMVVVDGLEALFADLEDPATHDRIDAFVRWVVESPGLRMAPVMTSTRVAGLRAALTGSVEQRWAFRLADPTDLALLGVRPDVVPSLPPGRCVRAADGRLQQVADPGDLAAAAHALRDRWPPPTRPPHEVGSLPARVSVADLGDTGDAADAENGVWRLPIGLAERDLGVAALELRPGEHALLLGPAASGRTGALGALGAVAARAGLAVHVVLGDPSSPLGGDGHPTVPGTGLADVLRAAAAGDRPTLLLVDDADRVPDPGALLEAVAPGGARIHVVAAARPDAVRTDYGHWLRRVTRSGIGVVLRPRLDHAAELLGARPPRVLPAADGHGRGWHVAGGEHSFVQLARIDDLR